MKKALITGITGQDNSCLAGLLLGKVYEVHVLPPNHLINLTDGVRDPYRFYLEHLAAANRGRP
jgi:GDP-D-mannose dehydratase